MAYSIRRVGGIGKEEKLAEKFNVIVSDLNLDLEQVGIRNEPKLHHDYKNWRMEQE
jgi:hypothetical protein